MDDDSVSLYTDEIKKHIYQTKARLPKDFPLVTDEREDFFIIIVVKMPYYAWRTVEERLEIALELEKLKQLIEGTGVGCYIEKTEEN